MAKKPGAKKASTNKKKTNTKKAPAKKAGGRAKKVGRPTKAELAKRASAQEKKDAKAKAKEAAALLAKQEDMNKAQTPAQTDTPNKEGVPLEGEAKGLWNSITGFFGSFFTGVKNAFFATGGLIKDAFNGLIDFFKGMGHRDFWDKLFLRLKNVFNIVAIVSIIVIASFYAVNAVGLVGLAGIGLGGSAITYVGHRCVMDKEAREMTSASVTQLVTPFSIQSAA